MSSSSHQIKIKAVDQTGGVFSSIQKKASVASSKIGGMLKGALAAAGAYMGLRAIGSAVSELGNLSDIAMRTSTSVKELTQTTTAMSVLGINTDINSLAKAFQMMEKNTGRSGLSGFYQTIQELGKISDVSKRAEGAMKAFGRSGLEFMPLINAANNGTVALQNVIEAMPKVSDKAAEVGDKLNDAKTIGVTGFKNLWLEAVAKVCEYFDNIFAGGIREAALNGVSYINYFVKSGWAKLKTFFTVIGLAIQGLTADTDNLKQSLEDLLRAKTAETWTKLKNAGVKISDWSGLSEFVLGHKINVTKSTRKERDAVQSAIDGILKNIDFDAIGATLTANDSYQQKLREYLDKELQRNKEAAQAISSAAKSSSERAAQDNIENATRKQQINNNLIYGGSSAALKLSVIGPQLQEEKKQTNILKEIATNTKNTALSLEEQETEIDINASIWD